MDNKIFLLGATCVLALFSCGGSSNAIRLSKLDIVGAKSLFFANEKKNIKSNDSTSTLFKEDENNYVQVVNYTWVDSQGKEIQDTRVRYPLHLYNFDEKYIYLDYRSGDSENSDYIIDTQTGNSYIFPEEASICFDPLGYYRGINCWVDKNGYKYYPAFTTSNGQAAICKINLTNPDDIKLSVVSLKDVPFLYNCTYAIDKDGNCFYEGVQDNPYRVVSYLVTSKGVSYKLDEGLRHRFWSGYDGNVYDFAKKEGTEYYYLYQWEVVGDTAELKEIKKCWKCCEDMEESLPDLIFSEKYKKVYAYGHQEDFDNPPSLMEIYDHNESGDDKYPMKNIDLSNRGFASSWVGGDWKISNDNIYLLGENETNKDIIVRIDASNVDEVNEPIELDNQYQFSDFREIHVAKNNSIAYEAKRLSDQSYVVITIDDGTKPNPVISVSKTAFTDQTRNLILI